MDTSLLFEHMEWYPDMVILTTNIAEFMDDAFKDRLEHKVEKMPYCEVREKIWFGLVPEKTPLSDDVDF